MHPRHAITAAAAAAAAVSRLTHPQLFTRSYRTKNALKSTVEPVVIAPISTDSPSDTPPPKPTRKRKPKAPPTAAVAAAAAASDVTVAPGSQHHHDLPTFLAYADRTGLDPATNVYVGTRYEYTVADSLLRLRFALTRVGRSCDRGIDLLGSWAPPPSPQDHRPRPPVRVLLQCKAEAPRPAMVRELEGAVVGAPAAWRADGVLALLVAAKEATKGVREAVARTAIPMGFLNVTPDGLVRQFLWNQAAVESGLEGVGVTLRYSAQKEHEIALTTDGLPWPASASTSKVV